MHKKSIAAIVLLVFALYSVSNLENVLVRPAIGDTNAVTMFDSDEPIQTQTRDGVTIYGQPYFGDLDRSAPLILLFHQAGSNGRGEYAAIGSWLNDNGFRSIAWDQRSGGELYGATNRTVAGLPADATTGYCDAQLDLHAALEYAIANKLADKVFLWGSSYSAALVFGLAAEQNDKVVGVIAFSPASGGPMVECRARIWLEDVKVPVYVLRPSSEMERASSLEQRDILVRAGAKFQSVEGGVHGSSMLLDDRTDGDMSNLRANVVAWLQRADDL